MTDSVFAREAQRYDDWYDSPDGAPLFRAELTTLRPLLADTSAPEIEIGVGSGRFAEELGIAYGLDPVIAPLKIARTRGVTAIVGAGEALPFLDDTFGATLFVFTLCFVEDPGATIREATRVTRTDGNVILGVVPADGPLGRHYQELADAGHRIYSTARFYTRPQLYELLDASGLEPVGLRSARMTIVNGTITPGVVADGDHPDAGFLAISTQRREDLAPLT